MAYAIQRRRGTATEHNSFTGLVGEITIDTTNNTIRVHDGSTAGGHRLAKFSELQTQETIEDAVGSLLTAGSGISLSYDDAAGTLTITNTTAAGDIESVTAGDGLSGGGTSGAVTLAVDLNELSAAAIDVSADSLPFIDASDNSSKKESVADLVSGMAGTNLTASAGTLGIADSVIRGKISAGGDLSYNSSTGVISFTNDAGDIESVTAGDGLSGGGSSGAVSLALDLNELTAATVDVAADSIAIIDAGDSSSKKESIADLASGMAGTNLTATSGTLGMADTVIRGKVSVTDAGGDGSLAYNNSTGVFTYTGPSAAEVRAHITASTGISITDGAVSTTITQYADSDARGAISVTDSGGDGSLAYNSGTGVITYTGPSASEVRAHLSGGTGVSYSGGAFSIGQAVATTSDVTFADVIVSGNLTVSGTQTSVNTETLTVDDNLIVLNNNETGTPSQDAGIEIERGTSTNVKLQFDEGTDKWQFTNDGSTYNDILTVTQVEALLSVTDSGGDGSLAYDNTTGVFTYTGPSAAEVRAHISVTDAGGDGSAAYNSSTGVITYTGPSAAETRAHFSASGGVNYDSSTGAISGDTAEIRTMISASGDISYDSSTGVISFTNDAGDIESVTAGNGLSGGGTSGAVSLAVDLTDTAIFTSTNTASRAVVRDGSGNFAAGVVTATATAARYADLAEKYVADKPYDAGTVLIVGGSQEVTEVTKQNAPNLAGVVSTDPAYLMNSELEGDNVVTVALRGRVPVKVAGPVRKGDVLIASSTPGHAEAAPFRGYHVSGPSMIGIAISEHLSSGTGVVEAQIK